MNNQQRSNKVKYSVWKHRLLPILRASGWFEDEINGKTYMVNILVGHLFEYRYYGNSAPVWIGPLEVFA